MQTAIRVIFMYLFILLGMRLLGKREFGQLAPMEVVSLILIPDFVSQAVIGNDYSMTTGIIAITTLFSMVFLMSLISHLSQRAEDIIEGVPIVLIHDGKLITENMNKERIAAAEIFSEMHKAGLERLDQIQWAILEDDGKIAIVPAEDSSKS